MSLDLKETVCETDLLEVGRVLEKDLKLDCLKIFVPNETLLMLRAVFE
jgi:hypothetical protein